ncbi:MAG: hypothetical protein AB4062_09475 [Crocosphaera sp.]
MKRPQIIFDLFNLFTCMIKQIDKYLYKNPLKYSFLLPKFIQKIDRYLLLNFPRIWVTKIHYVFFYSLLANVALNLLVLFSINGHPKDIIFVDSIIVITMICEFIFYRYWFEQQYSFNLEKEYANIKSTDSFLDIILCIICTLIIISSSWTMTVTAMYKVAHIAPANCTLTSCEMVTIFETKTINFCEDIEEQIQKINNNFRIKFCNNVKQFWIDRMNDSEKKIREKKINYNAYWLFHVFAAIVGSITAIFIKNYSVEISAKNTSSLSSLLFSLFFLVLLCTFFLLALTTYSPLIINKNDERNKYIIWLSIKSFLIYLCFVPLQKLILILTVSLPKK